MSQLRVSLDGILLQDEPIGLRNFEIEIVREDGFGGSEQILRDKTTTELAFVGDGYRYLCNLKRNDFCDTSTVVVEYQCGNEYDVLFTGTIPISRISFDLTRCIAKTEIRDESFTGKIKDYTKTEIPLYSSRTKNCEGLSPSNKNILFGSTIVNSFDVFDLFSYFINFITDNEISVVSDYLTENKLAITTGYNLHNPTGSLTQVYPTLTFAQLFEEVRKKTRIFLGIEYDVNNQPYLRIEQESYFYNYDKILTFDETPYGTFEKTDLSRIFNSIMVGSDKTELQPSDTGFVGGYTPDPYDPTDLSRTWIKQTYTSCGRCTNDINSEQNKLDLISSFIIDTDVIYEALNAVPTTNNTQYTNDDSIFMFEYSGEPPTANYTLDTATSVYIYNANLINSQVIDNYFGYTPQCITLKNSTENYFLVERESAQEVAGAVENVCVADITPLIGAALYDNNSFATASNEIFDNGNNVVGFTFTTPTDGSYVFKQSTNIQYLYGTFPDVNDTQPTYIPIFAIYDNSATLIDIVYGNSYVATSINEFVPTEFTSPVITLMTGYTVMAGMSICRNGVKDPNFDFYELTDTKWELLKDVARCETTEDKTDSKPVLLEFKSKLCYSDLKTARENKKGYFEIKGNPYWIKSIRWREAEDLTEFSLIGNVSLCSC